MIGKIKNRKCHICEWETPMGKATHAEECWAHMFGSQSVKIPFQIIITNRLLSHHAKEHPNNDFLDEELMDYRRKKRKACGQTREIKKNCPNKYIRGGG